MLPVLLYATLLTHFKASNGFDGSRRQDNDSQFSSIVREISLFCPTGNVCLQNSNRTEPPPGRIHCCRECSCAHDCGLFENCCFPKDDIYKLVDRTRYECILPTTMELNSNQSALYKSYYMIADNPHDELSNRTEGDNKTDTSGNMDVPCGQRTVNPWGNLHPVTSKSTGVIYKNEHCANAHGVKDGVKWLIGISCERMTGKNGVETEIFNYFEDQQRTKFNNTCYLHFFYPGSEGDIATEQCYQSLILSCENPNFQVPAGSNMTENEIREACKSDFISPYTSLHTVYRNIFCAICGMKIFLNKLWCTEFTLPPRTSQSLFNILIDYDVLKSFVSHDRDSGSWYRVCLQQKMKNFSDCRDMLCPSGQLRRFDGKCIYMMSTFEAFQFGLTIKLTPRSRIELRQLNDVESKVKRPKSKLKTEASFFLPDGHIWQPDVRVNYLLAHLMCLYPPKLFSFLLKELRNYVKKLWFINIGDVSVELIPDFSEFAYYRIFENNDCWSFDLSESKCLGRWRSLIPYGSDLANENSQRFFALSGGFRIFYETAVMITKLHYCNQIEIRSSEYLLQANKSTLYSSFTKRSLFNGEFAIVTDSEGNRNARVCLKDSYFLPEEQMKSMAETRIKWTKFYSMTIYFIVMWIFAN